MAWIPLICPGCKSWNIELKRSLKIRHIRHRLMGKRMYLCNKCHWSGFLGQEGEIPPLFWIIFIIMMLIMVTLSVFKI
jgi:hypothetical protein